MGPHDDSEQDDDILMTMRPCTEPDVPDVLRIINAAAAVYQGVIPDDRWHDPYMPLAELRAEMTAGVRFTGCQSGNMLVAVMGIQQVRNVRLIRHAYVLPEWQGYGFGAKLIDHLRGSDSRPILIGTWAAAHWAIRFYERHGFEVVSRDAIAPLLQAYWNVPERQIETSVVLAFPALSSDEARRLIADADYRDQQWLRPTCP